MSFLPYVMLVVISAYTVVGLIGSVDAEQVRERLAPHVPARIVGGIVVGLALLTLAQDGGGALATALSGGTSIGSVARHIWIADLTLEVPVVGRVSQRSGLLVQFGSLDGTRHRR